MIGAGTSTAEIAAALRLQPDGAGWRGRCPHCRYEADTLSLHEGEDGRALWRCHSCGDGHAIGAAIRDVFGGSWTPPAPREQHRAAASRTDAEKTKARARAIWDAGQPISGTLVVHYLASRGLPGIQSDALRFHPGLWCAEVEQHLPAMVAAVTDPCSGEFMAVHRTWLKPDGSGKADLATPKKTMAPVSGGVIALAPFAPGAALVLAEGIESALSAVRLMGRGSPWAAIAAGNLPRIAPPTEVAEIVIAADNDLAGQREAWAAALRWEASGCKVRIATAKGGGDANDELRRRQAAAPAPRNADLDLPPWEAAQHG